MRRTPEATALSPVTEISPISPVRLHMGAAAQFDRPAERVLPLLARLPAHRDHADLVAVFFAEQRARAGFAGVIHRHQPRGDFVVFQHHLVGDVLDAGEFFRP